jgi:hypothetical protein
MKRLLIVAALALLPVPAAHAVPSANDEANPAKACRAEQASLGAVAFAETWGTNTNKKNAFGKCVSAKVKEHEAEVEHAEAKANAAKKCKAERASLGVAAFREKYGTNRNKKNAFGKCVSTTAKLASSVS